MKHKHEAIKTSKEGVLILDVLEKITKDASHMEQFLEIQVRDRKTNVPSEETALAAKIG